MKMVIISRLNGSDGTNLKVTSNLKQEINISDMAWKSTGAEGAYMY